VQITCVCGLPGVVQLGTGSVNVQRALTGRLPPHLRQSADSSCTCKLLPSCCLLVRSPATASAEQIEISAGLEQGIG